ncbi:acyltransferase family protein [Asticcacaulis biprosthecium]|nr:DUF5009 domain-containing protein [Asticcacaulis biprosthecium]
MTQGNRWLALDILRGLSIIFMLLNLNPGSWSEQYGWVLHAKWEGATFIDMVAPVFLFCIGVAIPLSLRRRIEAGESNGQLAKHILNRAGILVLLGLFLNAYPAFDWAHMRIPGVLQRIGVCYGAVALFVLFTARREGGFRLNAKAGWIAWTFVLLSWTALLMFVPVPGFGAPRFDPVGSWPAYVDRLVLTTDHMFPWWPVDGKVVFDPDGLLSTWPVCANVLFGALVGHARLTGITAPILKMLVAGGLLMAAAVGLHTTIPIIKHIWTATFALFTIGFSLVSLGALTLLVERWNSAPAFYPAQVYGSNPLLAYMLSFLVAPLIDLVWLKPPAASIRAAGQALFAQAFEPRLASLCFALTMVTAIFLPLWVCWRNKWFLKL